MATRGSFQALADKLINKTFSDFRDDVVFELTGSFDYDTQTTPVLLTSKLKGIRLEFNKSRFDGQSVQQGDYKVVVEQQRVAFDVRSDNVNMTFNNKNVSVIDVEEDAARAALFIHVRDL